MTKSAVTRQRILDAAARVFREQGYANARLSDIAEHADLRTGSLYYYFQSRDDLVDEVLRVGIQRSREHVEEVVRALPSSASALDRVTAAVEAHIFLILELSDYASAEARVFGQLPPDIQERHQAAQREYGAYWKDLLEAAAEAGEIRPDADLFVVRMLAFGAMNWVAHWYRPGRGADADKVAREAVNLIIYGLVGPAAADSGPATPRNADDGRLAPRKRRQRKCAP